MRLVLRLLGMVVAAAGALAGAEDDLEAVIGRTVAELEESLAAARQYAAAVLAAGRSVARELERSRTAAEQYQRQARAALAAGRRDAARRAWVRMQGHDADVQRLQAQGAQAVQVGANVKRAVRSLEAAVAGARRTQRLILAWHHSGLARRRLHRLHGRARAHGESVAAQSRRLARELEALGQRVRALAADGDFLGGRPVTAAARP